jgi:hypothetical protein
LINVLLTHLPPKAVDYCQHLWQHYGFHLHSTKPRRTRLGDFRVLPNRQTKITVNANLNPYAFLITYVHEVAHADVHAQYGLQRKNSSLKPHGKAWQLAFQRLMQPLLTEMVFPAAILTPLRQYLNQPAATTYACPALMLAIRQFDGDTLEEKPTNQRLLRDLPEGSVFKLSQKMYVRGTLRRTRIVCKEAATGRSYAVLAHALVTVMMKDEL